MGGDDDDPDDDDNDDDYDEDGDDYGDDASICCAVLPGLMVGGHAAGEGGPEDLGGPGLDVPGHAHCMVWHCVCLLGTCCMLVRVATYVI